MVRRYLIPALVVAFWLNSMRLLVAREVAPALREAAEAAQGVRYTDLRRSFSGLQQVHMAIFAGRRDADRHEGRRVGALERSLQATGPRDMTVVTRVFLDVGALFPGGAWGPEMPTETVSRVKVADGRLVTLEASVRLRGSGSALLEAFGRVAGDKLNLTVRTAGQETRRTLPFEPDYLVDSVGAPFTGMPQLSVGRRWTVRGFNPISGSVSNVTAEVTRRERLTWQNEDLECHVVEIGETPFRSTAWVDDMGRTLRYDLMGFTFLLERPKAGPTEDRDDRNREPDTEVRREDGR